MRGGSPVALACHGALSKAPPVKPTNAAGLLVIGGFPGSRLPDAYGRALSEGRRGGAILFRQNVEGGVAETAALVRALHAASPALAPLVGVDQEGGRVARLKDQVLKVPPMRVVASWGDAAMA